MSQIQIPVVTSSMTAKIYSNFSKKEHNNKRKNKNSKLNASPWPKIHLTQSRLNRQYKLNKKIKISKSSTINKRNNDLWNNSDYK